MTQNTTLNPHVIDPNNHYLHKYLHKRKHITWSAVLAGALIAFGLTFLFNLLMIGVGFSVYTNNESGLMDIAFNGFILTLVGGFVLLFIAGWKTGKLIKLCPKHYYEGQPLVNSVPPATVDGDRDGKCHHCCSNAMTHGFLAWVVYLIISLVFFAFISSITALGFLKSGYLSLPAEYSQTNTNATHTPNANVESMNNSMTNTANAAAAGNSSNTAVSTQNQVKPVAPAVIHKKGSEVIAVFLIFLFGAAGSSIGSYLGLLSKKKCLRNKC